MSESNTTTPARKSYRPSATTPYPPASKAPEDDSAPQQTASRPASRNAPSSLSLQESRDEIGETFRLRGKAWKYGDNIDTDLIFPGRHTYTAHGPEEIASHALEDLDPKFAGQVKPGDIVVGGRNWGCGSSREQAVTCLAHCGVRAVIAVSFGRIFYRNAINQGLWALTVPTCAISRIQNGDPVEVDLSKGVIRVREHEMTFRAPDPPLRQIVEAGGMVAHVLANLAVEEISEASEL